MKFNIEKIGMYIAKYCFSLFIVLYSIANIFFTVRIYNDQETFVHYLFGSNIIQIILFIIILLLIVFLVKKEFYNLNSNKFIIIFLVACLVIGGYWIFSNHQELIELSDDYNCLRAARLIGKGDYGPLGYKSYINTYPHNLTFVSYLMIFTRLFGDNANIILRFINLIFVLIGYYSLYKISDELFENKTANNVIICLMFLSMQYVFYAFIIYSNVLSYSLALFSVWMFIIFYKRNKLLNLVLSMITIVVASALKNNSLIILIAEFIYLIIYIIKNKCYSYTLIMMATVFLLVISTSGIIKFWEKKSGNDYSNKLPTKCWIAYGLNYDERHPGGYMNEFESYHHENGFVQEFTEERAEYFIENVLDNFKAKPYLVLRFYTQKFLVSYTNPEYDAFMQYKELPQTDINKSIISGNINDTINNLWDATMSLISIGLLSYMIIRFRKISLLEMISGVIVFGGFLFHSFWEVKAIYTYQYFMYLLPYAAYGIVLLSNKLKGRNN